MAFSPSNRIFQDLEAERGERTRAQANAELYRQRCAEYEILIDKLRRREAALVYRLNLAENSQLDVAERLGGAIHEDDMREMDALEELQGKVSELEQIEFRKAEALQEFARGLRSQSRLIQEDLQQGLKVIEVEIGRSVAGVAQTVLASVRTDLQVMRGEVENELAMVQGGLEEELRKSLHAFAQLQQGPLDITLESLCSMLQIQMDRELFWDSVRLGASSEERAKARNRFLATCSIPRITMLEKSLELSQNAEARAKRLAVRLAEKHEEEMKREHAKADSLQRKLDQAMDALEKARADFDTVSLVLDQLTTSKESGKG